MLAQRVELVGIGERHGVNLGNFDPELIASVRVRRFDGAKTWTFIDE